MSTLSVGSLEGLAANSNVISVPTGHTLNVADAGALQIGGSGVVSAGLVHISRTTIGTAVSSVTVSGAFSSDYDTYRVIIANVDGSVSTAALRIRFGAVVTGYYGSRRVDLYTGSTSTIVRDNNNSSCQIGIIATSDNSNSIFDIQSPNLANWTNFYGLYNGSGYTGWFGGLQNSTTQFTAFDIFPDSGTITGGTIDVYGYAKA